MGELTDLAEAYIARYASIESAADNSTFWAFEEVAELVREHPATALAFLLECCEYEISDFCRANLAAGPLEDLLFKHGPTMIDAIEAQAAINATFKELLGGVWTSTMDQAIRERVEQMQGDLW
ncbi:MAG TPA: hypothetical protein VM555_08825 [Tahibacter sp.]|nr:hypothetical protein [Tahibacter sp.]